MPIEEVMIEQHIRQLEQKIEIINSACLQSQWLEYYVSKMLDNPQPNNTLLTQSRSLYKLALDSMQTSNRRIARSSR